MTRRQDDRSTSRGIYYVSSLKGMSTYNDIAESENLTTACATIQGMKKSKRYMGPESGI